jgi:acetyl-CoA C-acetyltransferase
MFERVAIVGVGWNGFRSISPDASYKEMMFDAATKAYADAGVDPRRDIQNFVTVAEDFHEGTSIFDEYTPDQLGGMLKPNQTIAGEGLHGLITGAMLVRTGAFDLVTVEAHSKASNILTLDEITAYALDPVLNRPLNFNPVALAGLEMARYLKTSGATREQCAEIVARNRRNALKNPSAAYGADLKTADVLASPLISDPLSSADIAAPADGAVVFVLASARQAAALKRWGV